MNLKPGDRIYLTGDHPWADHMATVERFEKIHIFNEIHPIVKIDGMDQECFVMEPTDYEIIRAVRSRRKRT